MLGAELGPGCLWRCGHPPEGEGPVLSPSTWARIPGSPGGGGMPGVTLFPSPPPRPAVCKMEPVVPVGTQGPLWLPEGRSQERSESPGAPRGAEPGRLGRARRRERLPEPWLQAFCRPDDPPGPSRGQQGRGLCPGKATSSLFSFRETRSWSQRPCSLPQAWPPATFLICLGCGHGPSVILLPGNLKFKATEAPMPTHSSPGCTRSWFLNLKNVN